MADLATAPLVESDVDLEILALEESSIQCECVDALGDESFHVMADSPVLDWNDPSVFRCPKEATWMAVLTFSYRDGHSTAPHYFCDSCFVQWQDIASLTEKL